MHLSPFFVLSIDLTTMSLDELGGIRNLRNQEKRPVENGDVCLIRRRPSTKKMLRASLAQRTLREASQALRAWQGHTLSRVEL
jgi:hypothetical protein